jgi:hypothetical protein
MGAVQKDVEFYPAKPGQRRANPGKPGQCPALVHSLTGFDAIMAFGKVPDRPRHPKIKSGLIWFNLL